MSRIPQGKWAKDDSGNPIRLTLPHDETNASKVYSFPNPMFRDESAWTVRYVVIPGIADTEHRSALYQILAMAEAYQYLTASGIGQENAVKKLRDIWRVRRALEQDEAQTARKEWNLGTLQSFIDCFPVDEPSEEGEG